MRASLLEPLMTVMTAKHGSCYVGRYVSFSSMVISKENLTSVVTKIRSLTLLLLVLSYYSYSLVCYKHWKMSNIPENILLKPRLLASNGNLFVLHKS